jgi:hypothetical protein
VSTPQPRDVTELQSQLMAHARTNPVKVNEPPEVTQAMWEAVKAAYASQIVEHTEDVADFARQLELLDVPTEPAEPLEVLFDASTLVDPTPRPGFLARVLRRLFG